jgi:hypothetical protein
MITFGAALKTIREMTEFPYLRPAWTIVFEAVRRAVKTGIKTDSPEHEPGPATRHPEAGERNSL